MMPSGFCSPAFPLCFLESVGTFVFHALEMMMVVVDQVVMVTMIDGDWWLLGSV